MSAVTENGFSDEKILLCAEKLLEEDGFQKKTADEALVGMKKILSACNKQKLYELAFSENPEREYREFLDEIFPRMSFNIIGWYIAALRILCRAVRFYTQNNILPAEEKTEKEAEKEEVFVLPEPTLVSARALLKKYADNPEFKEKEQAVKLCITQAGTENTEIQSVLKKLECVADVFSLKVGNREKIAEIIVKADLDKYISAEDEMAVEVLYSVLNRNNKKDDENLYTLSVLFCTIHSPKRFPVCNSYSMSALRYFRDACGFFGFENEELFKYSKYKKILSLFKEKYNLTGFSRMQVSHLLTLYGKTSAERK